MGNGTLLEDIFPYRNLNKRVSLLDFVGQGRVLYSIRAEDVKMWGFTSTRHCVCLSRSA
jgi:hypothetical protein